MGWTLFYRARSSNKDISQFVADANKNQLKPSWGCEPYQWQVKPDGSACGFTKVQFSWRSKRDFLKIVEELILIAEKWPHVRIEAADDFVLGDWWHVRNIKVNELNI